MMTAVFRRLGLSVLILFLVAVFVFLATEVLPGDALDAILTADDLANMEPEQIEEMRRDLGLDKPAAVRFWLWFSGIVVGDFGVSYIDQVPIGELIWHPLLNSRQLGLIITLIAAPVAFLIGATTGYWRGVGEGENHGRK